MTKAIVISVVVLSLSSSIVSAGQACCQPQQYYDWGRVRQQNDAARLRGIQQHNRVCNSIKSTGRGVMWTGC